MNFWNKPNKIETIYNPVKELNGINRIKVIICKVEPINKVFNGPIISEIYPNIILLNTAQNSIIDKISPPVMMLKP